jgi:hypothetical protein
VLRGIIQRETEGGGVFSEGGDSTVVQKAIKVRRDPALLYISFLPYAGEGYQVSEHFSVQCTIASKYCTCVPMMRLLEQVFLVEAAAAAAALTAPESHCGSDENQTEGDDDEDEAEGNQEGYGPGDMGLAYVGYGLSYWDSDDSD